jgi:PAS domain S-box-containing protein
MTARDRARRFLATVGGAPRRERHLAIQPAGRGADGAAVELRQLIRELEAERARLVDAQAVAKVGSWETELSTFTTIWSAETHRIFETDPATFRPTHDAFLERLPPGERTAVDEAFVRSIDLPGLQTIEHRLLMPDGRVKFVEERWRSFSDETGRPARAVGTTQDITDRKLTENALRESDEKFRQLADHITDAFWIRSADMRTLHYISPAFERIWGRSVESLYANPSEWADFIVPRDRARVFAAFDAVAGDWPLDVEYGITRPDGEIRSVRVRGFQVRDAAGAVIRHSGIVTDITERKALESRFLRAQRLESIGTLAGGIAHDLNNTLTPILMAVDMLREFVTDENALGLLATLQGSAQRGADLVQQVLSFARGVDGQRITVNPLHLMRELHKVMHETFPKSIDVQLVPGPGLWTVTGDPTQIHQVFMNLCVNARDAMAGGGRLVVTMDNVRLDGRQCARLHADALPGAYVKVHVQDAGTGIPPEMRDRIFEPFFTTKAIGEGTGLGLSTTMAIVRSHGGFIHLESEVGVGTAFDVYLPANTAEAAGEIVAARRAGPVRGNGELVLVVDDEDGILKVAQRLLERSGYRTLLAANGAVALAMYIEHHEDVAVVLTDMAMPVMDGPALILALKAMNPDVRIIGSSGLTSIIGIARAADAGAGHFLPKPYSGNALLEALQTALKPAAASPASPRREP